MLKGLLLSSCAPVLLFFALGMLQVRHASLTFTRAAPRHRLRQLPQAICAFNQSTSPTAGECARCSTAPIAARPARPKDHQRVGDASLSAVTDAVVWSYPEPRRIAMAGRVPILLLGVLTGCARLPLGA